MHCHYVLNEEWLSFGQFSGLWSDLSGTFEHGVNVQLIYIPGNVIYSVPGL